MQQPLVDLRPVGNLLHTGSSEAFGHKDFTGGVQYFFLGSGFHIRLPVWVIFDKSTYLGNSSQVFDSFFWNYPAGRTVKCWKPGSILPL